MTYHESPPSGERNGASKLYEADIPLIRKLSADGESYSKIAKLYRVGKTTIERIITGKTWKHV